MSTFVYENVVLQYSLSMLQRSPSRMLQQFKQSIFSINPVTKTHDIYRAGFNPVVHVGFTKHPNNITIVVRFNIPKQAAVFQVTHYHGITTNELRALEHLSESIQFLVSQNTLIPTLLTLHGVLLLEFSTICQPLHKTHE